MHRIALVALWRHPYKVMVWVLLTAGVVLAGKWSLFGLA